MRKRSVEWLREAIKNQAVDELIVVGGAVGAFLLASGQDDLVYQCGGLCGDGLETHDDQFSFCSHSLQRMVYPLRELQPLYCCYVCPYAAVSSVYEDANRRPVVLLKD